MSDHEHQASDDCLLPRSAGHERILDILSTVSELAPWVGGAVGNVLSGMSNARKMDRIRDVLVQLAERIQGLESDARSTYVETDHFQDLLEEALVRVQRERSEEKRVAYAAFLARDIESPGAYYDEKLRMLRSLEDLQADHIRIIDAMLMEPDPNPGSMGSFTGTLERRLPDILPVRIADLAQQLIDAKLVNIGSINAMMSGAGAEQLQNYFSEYGRRLVEFIRTS